MIPDIYIPTMGRTDKQLTYQTLPDFLKQKVIFVVRDFEQCFFEQTYLLNKVKVCPPWVTNVSTTRKFIQQLAGDTYHWVIDDDLKGVWLRDFSPEKEKPWAKTPMTDQLWRQLCKETHDLIREGFSMVTFAGLGFIPSDRRYPYKEGLVSTQWFVMNGKKCRPIQWDAINLADDIDGLMQSIALGLRVCRFERWCVGWAPYGAPGGCADERKLEAHNQSVLALAKKWHPFVQAVTPDTSKKQKNYSATSVYGGTQMLKTRSFFVKAYKHYAYLRVKK